MHPYLLSDKPWARWITGGLLGLGLVTWSIHSLVQGHLSIPMRGSRGIQLDGLAAIFGSLAVLSLGLSIHFDRIWAFHPRLQRHSRLLAKVTLLLVIPFIILSFIYALAQQPPHTP